MALVSVVPLASEDSSPKLIADGVRAIVWEECPLKFYGMCFRSRGYAEWLSAFEGSEICGYLPYSWMKTSFAVPLDMRGPGLSCLWGWSGQFFQWEQNCLSGLWTWKKYVAIR